MARTAALAIDQGSRWQAVIAAPVEWLEDLTGYSARCQVREEKDRTSTMLADLSAYLTVDAANNLVLADLPADVTALFAWTSGFYDMELYNSDPANDVRFLQGTIKVDKEVTD